MPGFYHFCVDLFHLHFKVCSTFSKFVVFMFELLTCCVCWCCGCCASLLFDDNMFLELEVCEICVGVLGMIVLDLKMGNMAFEVDVELGFLKMWILGCFCLGGPHLGRRDLLCICAFREFSHCMALIVVEYNCLHLRFNVSMCQKV